MKKIFLILATLVALCSCNKTIVPDTPDEPQIDTVWTTTSCTANPKTVARLYFDNQRKESSNEDFTMNVLKTGSCDGSTVDVFEFTCADTHYLTLTLKKPVYNAFESLGYETLDTDYDGKGVYESATLVSKYSTGNGSYPKIKVNNVMLTKLGNGDVALHVCGVWQVSASESHDFIFESPKYVNWWTPVHPSSSNIHFI